MTREKLLALLSAGLDAKPEWFGDGVRLSQMPWIATQAYLHRIYPPLATPELEALEARLQIRVPADYRSFLLSIGNGARLFELTLNGFVVAIDRSMSDPLGQPISLEYGNVVERPRGLDEGAMAIGGMVGWSSRGCLVMEPTGEVSLVHPKDGRDVALRWKSLDCMLEEELARLSSGLDRSGRWMGTATEVMPPEGRRWETEVEPRGKSWWKI